MVTNDEQIGSCDILVAFGCADCACDLYAAYGDPLTRYPLTSAQQLGTGCIQGDATSFCFYNDPLYDFTDEERAEICTDSLVSNMAGHVRQMLRKGFCELPTCPPACSTDDYDTLLQQREEVCNDIRTTQSICNSVDRNLRKEFLDSGYLEPLVPTDLTGYQTKVGRVIESGHYSSFRGFHGFQLSPRQSRWISNTFAPEGVFLGFKFIKKVQVDAFRLNGSGGPQQRIPKDYELQGSNDGVTWDTLFSRNLINLENYTIDFLLDEPAFYRQFRVFISDDFYPESYPRASEIRELQFFRRVDGAPAPACDDGLAYNSMRSFFSRVCVPLTRAWNACRSQSNFPRSNSSRLAQEYDAAFEMEDDDEEMSNLMTSLDLVERQFSSCGTMPKVLRKQAVQCSRARTRFAEVKRSVQEAMGSTAMHCNHDAFNDLLNAQVKLRNILQSAKSGCRFVQRITELEVIYPAFFDQQTTGVALSNPPAWGLGQSLEAFRDSGIQALTTAGEGEKWFGYELREPTRVDHVRVTLAANPLHISFPVPKDWSFQGSQDGSEWINLHTEVDSENVTNIDLEPSVTYRFYRLLSLRDSAGNSPPQEHLAVQRIELLREL